LIINNITDHTNFQRFISSGCSNLSTTWYPKNIWFICESKKSKNCPGRATPF